MRGNDAWQAFCRIQGKWEKSLRLHNIIKEVRSAGRGAAVRSAGRIARTAVVAGIVAVAVVAAGCSRRQAAPAQHPVEYQAAIADTVRRSVSFPSRIESNYDAVIQPRVAGYLASIGYKEGMPVKKGQVLYTIDPVQISTELDKAMADHASAQAALIEAKNNMDRAVPLAAMDAISRSDLDKYTSLHASAQATVRSTASGVQNARLNLGYTVIRSPIDGIVGEPNLTVGEYVGVGSELSVLTTVSSIDSVSVRLSMPVTQYLELRGGGPAFDNKNLLSDITMVLSDGSEYPYKGMYDYTEQQVNPTMGSVVLRIMFPNPGWVLKPGQFVRVKAYAGEPRRVVMVPQRAVVQSQGTDGVYVADSLGKPAYRSVVLGVTHGKYWIIESGVGEGEKVATER